MSKKEFIEIADGHVKDMNRQIAEKRKEFAAKPLVPVSFVKVWLQRLALIGLVAGLFVNEVLPKLRKQFNF